MLIYETLSLLSISVVLLGSAYAWSRIMRRRQAGLPILDQQPARVVPWSIIDVIIMLALTFSINSVLFMVAGRFLDLPQSSVRDATPLQLANAIFLFSISSLLSMALTVFIVPWRTGATWRDFGVDRRYVTRDIAIGAMAFFALSVPVYSVQLVLALLWKDTSHPLVELLREDPTPRFFLMSAFSAALVAPLVEEFFFRVLLQGWLETVFHRQDGSRRAQSTSESAELEAAAELADPAKTAVGAPDPASPPVDALWIGSPSGWAIVISAFLFALAHSGNGPDPIPLFVFALGLGYVYQRTRRILPCLVIHVMLNSLTLMQLWLYVHMEQ